MIERYRTFALMPDMPRRLSADPDDMRSATVTTFNVPLDPSIIEDMHKAVNMVRVEGDDVDCLLLGTVSYCQFVAAAERIGLREVSGFDGNRPKFADYDVVVDPTREHWVQALPTTRALFRVPARPAAITRREKP